MLRSMIIALLVLLFAAPTFAGMLYRVTSKKGDQTVKYQVYFGGGRLSERYTAFDPATNRFVYLNWKRGEEAPEPVCSIWDYKTGRTIPLYKFEKPNTRSP